MATGRRLEWWCKIRLAFFDFRTVEKGVIFVVVVLVFAAATTIVGT
jgi:hypothetical protein